MLSPPLRTPGVWTQAVRLAVLVCVLATEAAWAGRVVVLDIDGDGKRRVVRQVEGVLQDSPEVDLISIARYKKAVAKRRLRARTAMGPRGVRAVAKTLDLDVALAGAVVGRKVILQLLDRGGAVLWSKELPLRKGWLSNDHLKKLSAVIHAALPESSVQATKEVVPEAPLPAKIDPTPLLEPQTPAAPPPPVVAESRARPQSKASEAQQTRIEAEVPPAADAALPAIVTLNVTGTTTWRSYCARPGVARCAQFDNLDATQRAGKHRMDFSPDVPYAGATISAELFPLARVAVVGGLGLIGSYGRAWSISSVSLQSATNRTDPKDVISVDEAWSASATYRLFFTLASQTGHAALRGGLVSRSFDPVPTASVVIPGSHRRFPQVGVDLLLPLAKVARIDLSGSYFVDPRARGAELPLYGTTVKADGFGVEGGVSGTVVGPLGYVARLRYLWFRDHFSGAGQRPAWENGGVAQETYASLHWGLQAAF